MIAPAAPRFAYDEAFSRTVGWLTRAEQQALRGKRIAIAGLGGVGGGHAQCLARLGIGAMHLADPDRFELANMNRQAGAGMDRLGQAKVDVLAEDVRRINPECDLRTFSAGISADNLDEFLAGVDLYVDGLDLYAFDARARVFAACHRRGIPALTAGPLGMGTAIFAVLPGGMSFEQYVRWEGCDDDEKLLRMLVALAPTALHRHALVDPTAIDLARHRLSSTPMGCWLASGAIATEALKILLGRGPVAALPRSVHYDAYSHRLRTTWRPWGNANPIQQVVLAIARRQAAHIVRHARPAFAEPEPESAIERIIARARWAPSAGNAQPWRFMLDGGDRCTVRIAIPVDHCPTLLAAGGLAEALRLAATAEGLRAHVTSAMAEGTLALDVRFTPDPLLTPDPLVRWLPVRCTHRGAYRTRPLTAAECAELAGSVGSAFEVRWHQGADRRRFAALERRARRGRTYASRTQSPVAVDVDFSVDRVPAGSLDRSWLSSATRCAAYVAILARVPPIADDDWLAAGAAALRFWLTATRLGLQHQPTMSTAALARRTPGGALHQRFDRLLDGDARRLAWLGRIGAGDPPGPRALRLPLSALIAP